MPDFILTLLSPQSIAPQLNKLAKLLKTAGCDIAQQTHLSPEFDAQNHALTVDAYQFELKTLQANLAAEIEISTLISKLKQASQIDAILQSKAAAKTRKKLACFDMDSTLIQHEVMDELAIRYGIGEKISAITAAAMRGEINFGQSFEQRIACLKGFDASLIPEIANELKLMPGAITLFKCLKAKGIKTAILSGGFLPFAEHIQGALGEVDYIVANELEIINGKLTGNICNKLLVDEKRKFDLINALTQKNGWEISQSIAVGDGANDIPMLQCAGLGVAYHAKPMVQEKTPHCVNHCDLSGLIHFLNPTS